MISMINQYKSAAYEMDKATDVTGRRFPYSIHYKKEAMRTLMLANGVNFVLAFAYLLFVLPNHSDEFNTTTLGEVYGNSNTVRAYFFFRTVVFNVSPLVMTMAIIYLSDVVFMESKWWLIVEWGIAYIIVNYTVSVIKQTYVVYYIDWERTSDITPFSPIFGSFGLILAAITWHFMVSSVTQTWHGRYESQFEYISGLPVSPDGPFVPA
jgi:hypothetical protein